MLFCWVCKELTLDCVNCGVAAFAAHYILSYYWPYK